MLFQNLVSVFPKNQNHDCSKQFKKKMFTFHKQFLESTLSEPGKVNFLRPRTLNLKIHK